MTTVEANPMFGKKQVTISCAFPFGGRSGAHVDLPVYLRLEPDVLVPFTRLGSSITCGVGA